MASVFVILQNNVLWSFVPVLKFDSFELTIRRRINGFFPEIQRMKQNNIELLVIKYLCAGNCASP